MEAIDRVVDYMIELGIKVDIKNSFDSRFKVQKISYLMHNFLKDYKFYPYLHGPYSPALTRDYFKPENIQKFENYQKIGTITADESEALKRLKNIESAMSNPQLEAMAMAYYLIDNKLADWSNIAEKVQEVKRGIKYEDIVVGINSLKLWLVTRKQWEEAMKDLKEENEFWDKISEVSRDS